MWPAEGTLLPGNAQEAWSMEYTKAGSCSYLWCPWNVPATCILIGNRLRFLPPNSCMAMLDKGCISSETWTGGEAGGYKGLPWLPPLPFPTRQQRDWLHLLGPVWFTLLPLPPTISAVAATLDFKTSFLKIRCFSVLQRLSKIWKAFPLVCWWLHMPLFTPLPELQCFAC